MTYRTPVWVWPTDRGYLVALTYGEQTEWLKNVLAADGGRIEQRGQSVAVGNPRVVGPERALRLLPQMVRPVLRSLRIQHWLLLDR